MADYATDREFADDFLSKQKVILAPLLGLYTMKISDFIADVKHASDLTILRGPNNIGLRVRRPKYSNIYGLHEFTIRSLRDSGATTELEKYLNGYSDWFAYFHSDYQGRLPHWLVVDLAAFRRYSVGMKVHGRHFDNADGTYFRVYSVKQFPVGILIGASDSVLADLPPLYGFATQRRQNGLWDPSPAAVKANPEAWK